MQLIVVVELGFEPRKRDSRNRELHHRARQAMSSCGSVAGSSIRTDREDSIPHAQPSPLFSPLKMDSLPGTRPCDEQPTLPALSLRTVSMTQGLLLPFYRSGN